MMYDPREFAHIRNAAFAISGLAWILLLLEPGAEAMHSHGHALDLLAAANWFLMLAAMMAPVLTPSIYHLRASGFARRRGRSTLLFVPAYAGVWIAVGGVLLAIVEAQRSMPFPRYALAAITLTLALVWQCSPFKRVCLNRCHGQTPLAGLGAAADFNALRFGATHAIWCSGSCWLWMLLPMLPPQGHVAAMAIVSVLIFCERLEHPKPPKWQLRGFGKAMRILAARSNMPVRVSHV